MLLKCLESYFHKPGDAIGTAAEGIIVRQQAQSFQLRAARGPHLERLICVEVERKAGVREEEVQAPEVEEIIAAHLPSEGLYCCISTRTIIGTKPWCMAQ